jgi:hypothetical protein
MSPQANWQLDCDYAHKLSPEDREWLSRFTSELYLSQRMGILSDEERRAAWRSYKRQQKDLFSRGDAVGLRTSMPEAAGEHPEAALVDAIDARRAADSVPNASPDDASDAILSEMLKV